nr:basic helix-loop-helix transcription factor [Loropetalum chinense var. rubrum]
MDSAFSLDAGARANFLRFIVHSFDCTYVCLWIYSPHPFRLSFMDGFFNEDGNQPSSSSGTSRARRLFEEYQRLDFPIENGHVPGLAFRNNLPYVEIKELDLQRLATKEIQWQFYQEARIKTAAFMGCKNGEIEIGLSNVNQINMENEMRNCFPQHFPKVQSLIRDQQLPQPTDQNPPASSSSSSLLSLESSEYSPFLFNIPSTSYIPTTLSTEAPIIEQAILRPISTIATQDQANIIQAFSRIPNVQFLTPEAADAAMTRAMLAVLSSPSSSSSSYQPPQQNLASAFTNYSLATLGPTTQQFKPNPSRRQSMLKRAITYFKSLNLMRNREQMQGSRPTGTQLHHMMSERKRREKLNESFQALRSLLPPGSKKDKASVLSSTREYLSSLKVQVSELNRRNQVLEAQLLPANKEGAVEEVVSTSGSSNGERVDVRITQISESTSTQAEERIVDLQVIVRTDASMLDLMIRILEFLKQVENLSLIFVNSETHLTEPSSMYRLVFRLRIEGTEWDESAFQEAVRGVVADLAQ